jgi:D-alanyl-D-alanine carboxypeptidase
VIYEKNADKKIYPASITKLMTAILVYNKFKNNLDQSVTVEQGDIDPLYGSFGMMSDLKAGEQISVRNLLYCLLVKSGDDSANVLARATAGSVDAFVAQMNAKAQEIGLKNTHYVNPHGLHDPDHYTTAYDVYLLSRYAMKIPYLAKVVSTVDITIPATNKNPARQYPNTNLLLNPNYRITYYYPYVKGIKTGTTTPAGTCLSSYAEKDGITYYCVAMGGAKEPNTAFTETRMLYEWVFGNFEIQPVVKTTDVAANIPVKLSSEKTKLLVVPQTQINALVPDTFTSSTDLKYDPHIQQSVTAPVVKGQKIGYEDVYLINSQTKKAEKISRVTLVAGESADRSMPLYVLYLVQSFFSSVWFKIVAGVLIALLILYISLSVYANSRRKRRSGRRGGKKYNYKRRR